MTTKKTSNLTAKTRKKSATSSSKIASKASKSTTRPKAITKKRREELNQLASRMFQMVYEDYQQGKFYRIL